MMMDHRVILAGQTPDLVGNFLRGQQGGQQAVDFRYQQDHRNALAQHGAGAVNGDPTAMNALAAFDPAGVQRLQQFNLNMDATRQNMLVQQRQDRRADERLELAREEGRRAFETHAANMTTLERQRFIEDAQADAIALFPAQTPEEWDRIATERGDPELVGRFEDRDYIFAAAVAGVQGLQQGLQMLTPQGPETVYEGGQWWSVPGGGQAPTALTEPGAGGSNAAEQQISRLMELGLSREEAIRSRDLYEVSRDPVTGEVMLIDRSNGQRVNMQAQPGQLTGIPSVETLPLRATDTPTASPGGAMPENTDFATATGVTGFGRQLANTFADMIGAGLPYANNETATQAMENLRTRTMTALAAGVPGRPNVFLLERFDELLAEPNSPWQGQGRTRERLEQVQRMIVQAKTLNEQVADGRIATTPTARSEAAQNVEMLDALLLDYGAVLEAYGTGGPAQNGGQTTGGVTWRIVE